MKAQIKRLREWLYGGASSGRAGLSTDKNPFKVPLYPDQLQPRADSPDFERRVKHEKVKPKKVKRKKPPKPGTVAAPNPHQAGVDPRSFDVKAYATDVR